jgi:hypothetical protein
MNTLQQEQILQTKRICLTKGRTFRHYLDTIILGGISLFSFFLVLKGCFKEGNQNNPLYFPLPYIFLFFAILLLIDKSKSLKLKELSTNYSKHENYKIVKEALHVLGWHIKVDNKGFIEAYTNSFGFWTWTDQMVSILITDNRILFNSISNVDSYATQPITWGQNSRNRKKFKDSVDLIAMKHIS